MKSRMGYKGFVIEGRSYQQQGGGFSAELWIEEHDVSGVTETQFYLPDTFPTQAPTSGIGIGYSHGEKLQK